MHATTIPLGRAMAPEPRHEDTHNGGPRLVCNNTHSDTSLDHFIKRDGKIFAGTHLIIDLWGAKHLDELPRMEKALRDAVEAAGATLLHIHLHHFTPNGGISGVAVLAESHISVHTWPERDFASIDIFMCGACDPAVAMRHMADMFKPGRIEDSLNRRGVVKAVAKIAA